MHGQNHIKFDHFNLIIHPGTSVKSFQSLRSVLWIICGPLYWPHRSSDLKPQNFICQATGKVWCATKMWKYEVHHIVTVWMLQLL